MDVLEISRKTCTNARLLRRCVNRDKNKIGLLDPLVHVCRKEQVAPAGLTYNVLEAWLVNRELEIYAVPSINTFLVEVDDSDHDIRTSERNYGACWTALSDFLLVIRATNEPKRTHRRILHQLQVFKQVRR